MGSLSFNRWNIFAVGLLIIATVLFLFSRMPGGIGGTGINGAPGGIGGTGIYGRIDGFGSIWVNGVEIFYDDDQNVVRQGRDGLPDRLAIGQMVAVIVDDSGKQVMAKSIEIIEEVNGPIERISDDQWRVLGQDIIITDKTLIDIPEEMIVEGKQIAISGYRGRDDQIIASLVTAPLIEGEMSLRGRVDKIDEDGFWIEDMKVMSTDHGLSIGDTAEVDGMLEGENMKVERLRIRGPMPFDRVPQFFSYQMLIDKAGNGAIGSELISLPTAKQNIPAQDIDIKERYEVAIIKSQADVRENKLAFRDIKVSEIRQVVRKRVMEKIATVNETASDIDILPVDENLVQQPLEQRRNRIVEKIIEKKQQADPETVEPVALKAEAPIVQKIIQRREEDIADAKNKSLETERARRQARRAARIREELDFRRLRILEERRRRIAELRNSEIDEVRRQAVMEARREALNERERLTEAELDELRDNTKREAQREAREEARKTAQENVREDLRERARRAIRRRNIN